MTYNNNNFQKNYESQYCNREIKKTLSKEYEKADVFLPGKILWNIANDLKEIPSSQMRKVLDEIKNVSFSLNNEDQINESKTRLFMIVPMTAYLFGRNNKNISYKNLYNFIKNHINEVTIQAKEDIKMLDKIYTCIIAYHKSLSKK